ncbi:hypothetical protein RQN30_01065 [Arcanobacterium hippocoleae]
MKLKNPARIGRLNKAINPIAATETNTNGQKLYGGAARNAANPPNKAIIQPAKKADFSADYALIFADFSFSHLHQFMNYKIIETAYRIKNAIPD